MEAKLEWLKVSSRLSLSNVHEEVAPFTVERRSSSLKVTKIASVDGRKHSLVEFVPERTAEEAAADSAGVSPRLGFACLCFGGMYRC